MTQAELRTVDELYKRANFGMNKGARNFISNLYKSQREATLSPRQLGYLWAIAFSYRKVLPVDLRLIAAEKSNGVGINSKKTALDLPPAARATPTQNSAEAEVRKRRQFEKNIAEKAAFGKEWMKQYYGLG